MDCQSVLPQIEDPKEELGKYEERNACKIRSNFCQQSPARKAYDDPGPTNPLASPGVEASACAAWRRRWSLGSCCVTSGFVWTPRAVSSLTSSMSKLTVGTHSLLLRSDLEMDESRMETQSQELHAPKLSRNTEAALRVLPPSVGFEKAKSNESRGPGR